MEKAMQGSHTTFGKVLHWGFIVLFVYGIAKQVDDLSQLEDSALLAFEVMFATVFLAIVVMRYLYMRRFETFLGATEPVPIAHRYLAKSIHVSMYLCLIMLPLSGLLIAFLFTRGIEDGPMQDFAISLHGFSADLSYLLIAVHIGAALWSRIKGEGVWTSMVPVWREEGPTRNEFVTKLSDLENEAFRKVERALMSGKE